MLYYFIIYTYIKFFCFQLYFERLNYSLVNAIDVEYKERGLIKFHRFINLRCAIFVDAFEKAKLSLKKGMVMFNSFNDKFNY